MAGAGALAWLGGEGEGQLVIWRFFQQLRKTGSSLESARVVNRTKISCPGGFCMNRRTLLSNIGLFLLLCSLAINAYEKPTSTAVAAAAVEANMKTPEGKAYDAQIGRDLAKKYPPVMKACKEKAEGDTRSFDMLVRVDKDGTVKEVLLHPATRISQCLREAILKDTFSPPPNPAHWVDIHIDVKR